MPMNSWRAGAEFLIFPTHATNGCTGKLRGCTVGQHHLKPKLAQATLYEHSCFLSSMCPGLAMPKASPHPHLIASWPPCPLTIDLLKPVALFEAANAWSQTDLGSKHLLLVVWPWGKLQNSELRICFLIIKLGTIIPD